MPALLLTCRRPATIISSAHILPDNLIFLEQRDPLSSPRLIAHQAMLIPLTDFFCGAPSMAPHALLKEQTLPLQRMLVLLIHKCTNRFKKQNRKNLRICIDLTYHYYSAPVSEFAERPADNIISHDRRQESYTHSGFAFLLQ